MKIFKNSFYRNFLRGKSKNQKYLIIQLGKERSIIQNTSSITNDILIVDNQYLMNLDDLGVII